MSKFIESKQARIDGFIGIVLGLSFLKTILLQFLHLLFGYGDTSIAIIVYGVLFSYLLYGVVKYRLLSAAKIWGYLLTLVAFALFFFVGPAQCHKFYLDIDMLLTYFYYIPIAIFLVPSMTAPEHVLNKLVSFRYVGLIVAAYMLFFGAYTTAEQDNYMEFSYAVLPFAISCFYYAFYNSRFLDYAFYALGVSLMVIYGARTPLVISLISPLLIAFFGQYKRKRNTKSPWIFGGALVFLILFFTNTSAIIGSLGGFGARVGSYALMRLEYNVFTESSTREDIYNNAINLLSQDYFKPFGLFADRIYLDVVYVHNIFLELCINYSLVIGILISIALVILIIRSIFINRHNPASLLLIFFLMVVFLRLLVSGSYLLEGMSFVFLALLLKFKKKYTVTDYDGK